MNTDIPEQLLNFPKNTKKRMLLFKIISIDSGVVINKPLVEIIYESWFFFRIENKDMCKLYPDISKAVKYLSEHNDRIVLQEHVSSEFYIHISNIFSEYIITNPKKYVVIKFMDDYSMVNVIKQNDSFHIVSQSFEETDVSFSEISKILEKTVLSDETHNKIKEGYRPIITATIFYDELTDESVFTVKIITP